MSKDEKKLFKSAPVRLECPALYTDGVISMSGQMITTESEFIQLWGLHRKGQDMKAAYKKARKWRDKFKD
jgi:hypothetical protein